MPTRKEQDEALDRAMALLQATLFKEPRGDDKVRAALNLHYFVVGSLVAREACSLSVAMDAAGRLMDDVIDNDALITSRSGPNTWWSRKR